MNLSSTTGPGACITREQFEKARDYLLPRLMAELPDHLTYHNAAHTTSVLKATEYLVYKEGVVQDKWLLLSAALFHDAGFLRSYDSHEEMSCIMAWEFLPAFGYSKESIEAVCRLIMVTKLPQKPTNLYENILCDADLFYLGKAEFPTTADHLFREWKAVGYVQSEEEWQTKQLKFLQQHQYFTATARTELEPAKKAQTTQLQQQFGSGDG